MLSAPPSCPPSFLAKPPSQARHLGGRAGNEAMKVLAAFLARATDEYTYTPQSGGGWTGSFLRKSRNGVPVDSVYCWWKDRELTHVGTECAWAIIACQCSNLHSDLRSFTASGPTSWCREALEELLRESERAGF